MKAVVITGASSGIGRECALHLSSRGYRVFAGVRSGAAAEELLRMGRKELAPLIIDVTDQCSIAAAAAQVSKETETDGLFGLVNNAGITVAGPLEILPLDALRRQFEVNVIGQLAVIKAFLPRLRAAKGRIILMGSILGRLGVPFIGAYGGSKFALEALADCFGMELFDWGISVSILEPGNVATPIWEKSRNDLLEIAEGIPNEQWELYSSRLESFERAIKRWFTSGGVSPLRVAKAVEKVLSARSPRTRYLVGADAKILGRLARLVSDRFRHRITRGIFFSR
jgi:NAD(P)-dependent dehydrogenase (short-subunit alcohol dehydrogenase family)